MIIVSPSYNFNRFYLILFYSLVFTQTTAICLLLTQRIRCNKMVTFFSIFLCYTSNHLKMAFCEAETCCDHKVHEIKHVC
jgi:hypothetical protein